MADKKTDDRPDRFRRWDPSTLAKHFSICIYGVTGSGKTHLLDHLLHSMKTRLKKHHVFLFSGTVKEQKGAYTYIPKKNQFSSDFEEELAKLMKEQGEDKHAKRDILLVFDDVVMNKRIRTSPLMLKLSVLGRHLRMSYIVLSQCCNPAASIPRSVRGNLHAIMCNRVRSAKDRDILVEEYFSLVSKKEGLHAFDEATAQPYAFAVLDLRKHNVRRLEDYLYVYSAPKEKPPQFNLGVGHPIGLWAEPPFVLTDGKGRFEYEDVVPEPEFGDDTGELFTFGKKKGQLDIRNFIG